MSNRPRYSDEAIILHVVQKLLPRIIQWAEGCGTDDEIENEIADAIRRSAPLFEAEEIAHYLEKRHLWASDKKLIGILDEVDGEAESARRRAVAHWVEANGIRPKKCLGDLVDVLPRATDKGQGQLKGEIIAVDYEQATYTVFVAARGHVKTGLGTHGHVLPFEEFHELAASPEEFVLAEQVIMGAFR